MSGVSIGMATDEETGEKVVHLYVQGQGHIVFGSDQAILYGNTLIDFGRTAECINEIREEQE